VQSGAASNGMVERWHRTLKDEFFSLAYSRKIYESIEALQADLDRFVAFYNGERAHHGYRTQGRTPFQTFHDHLARPEVTPVAA
jgi:Integrase core domain